MNCPFCKKEIFIRNNIDISYIQCEGCYSYTLIYDKDIITAESFYIKIDNDSRYEFYNNLNNDHTYFYYNGENPIAFSLKKISFIDNPDLSIDDIVIKIKKLLVLA